MHHSDWRRNPYPWVSVPEGQWMGVSTRGTEISDDWLLHQSGMQEGAAAIVAKCKTWLPFLNRLPYALPMVGIGALDEIERWFAGYCDGEFPAGRESRIDAWLIDTAERQIGRAHV